LLLFCRGFVGLARLFQIADFVCEELAGDEVRGKLEGLARCKVLPAWVDMGGERTFFELEMENFNSDCQNLKCKALNAMEGGICKVTNLFCFIWCTYHGKKFLLP
jgi:hypothetical protein